MIDSRQKIPVSKRIIYSHKIFEKIESLKIFQTAEHVLLYWSMDDEVYTRDMINKWKDKKNIILPVTLQEGLKLKQYTGDMKIFKTSKFILFEPVGKHFISPDIIELAIVPGLAFDFNNNRLGYGKGYYDKLLADMQTYKIGVCYNFQLFKNIPFTETDVKMDMVITA